MEISATLRERDRTHHPVRQEHRKYRLLKAAQLILPGLAAASTAGACDGPASLYRTGSVPAGLR